MASNGERLGNFFAGGKRKPVAFKRKTGPLLVNCASSKSSAAWTGRLYSKGEGYLNTGGFFTRGKREIKDEARGKSPRGVVEPIRPCVTLDNFRRSSLEGIRCRGDRTEASKRGNFDLGREHTMSFTEESTSREEGWELSGKKLEAKGSTGCNQRSTRKRELCYSGRTGGGERPLKEMTDIRGKEGNLPRLDLLRGKWEA